MPRVPGLQSSWWNRAYSVAPDGRLLVIRNLEEPQPRAQILVVINWLEELKRSLP